MSKVSIVLPTYNGSEYIRESILSIKKQTLEDFELIIVDDCSSDDTNNIIDAFAKEDSRIRVITNSENMGLPKSLNIGFKYASSEYLTWTSDDNMYKYNALEEMYNYLESNKQSMMVCAGMYNIDMSGNIVGNTLGSFDMNHLWIRNCVGACFLYRKGVLQEIGNYDDKMKYVEDYEYWLRILKNYGNIAYIEKCLYYYRFWDGALTSTKKKEIVEQRCKLQRKYLSEIVHNIKNDKVKWTALYYDFLEGNKDFDIIKNVMEIVPELKKEKCDKDKAVIIFGCGKIGREVCRQIGEKVLFFADNDSNKVGTFVDGIKVISVDEMISLSNDTTIVISVANYRKYDIIKQLLDLGQESFCTDIVYLKNRNIKQ